MLPPLIVLDINETFATKIWNDDFTRVKWIPHEGSSEIWRLVLDDKIKLMFWSGAWKSTVDEFSKQCIPEKVKDKILSLWCRDDSEIDDEQPNIKNGINIAVVKDLQRVWNKFPEYNETNTVIFDDSPVKIRRNKDNAYLVPKESSNILPIINFIKCYLDSGLTAQQFISSYKD